MVNTISYGEVGCALPQTQKQEYADRVPDGMVPRSSADLPAVSATSVGDQKEPPMQDSPTET